MSVGREELRRLQQERIRGFFNRPGPSRVEQARGRLEDERIRRARGFLSAPAPASAPAVTAEQQSARAMLRATLAQYGLESLGDWVWQQYLNGSPIEQIFLDLRQRPEYKARFPAMEALSKKGRAIDEAQYIAYERGFVELMNRYSVTGDNFRTADFIGKFIGGEVALTEVNERLQERAMQVFETDPVERAELSRLYGISLGDLMGMTLDPVYGLEEVRRKYVSAGLAAEGTRARFGAITREEAEALATRGVTQEQAAEGFGRLYEARELFTPLEGGEETVSREEQLGAAFGGDASAQEKVRKQAERRVARFGGGGRFAGGQGGVSGLGSV